METRKIRYLPYKPLFGVAFLLPKIFLKKLLTPDHAYSIIHPSKRNKLS
ncbi:hypothetical protein CPL00151_CDS0250 [Escherichia phage Delraymugoa]